MKYWSDDEILYRDILEGEAIFDKDRPHPAYAGTKLVSSGVDILYELELVPGSEREEEIIDTRTFRTITDTVVDVLYRRWNDNKEKWDEIKITAQLSVWGYTTIPQNTHATKISQFDKAMKGI